MTKVGQARSEQYMEIMKEWFKLIFLNTKENILLVMEQKEMLMHITGSRKVDDVLNVSGHRIGTAEVESAIVTHPDVAEAAVVGIEHDIKGQAIYAFVILKGTEKSNELVENEIIDTVSKSIGKIAKPEAIHITRDLPKTRSGKIMRRILRKIANKDTANLGDVTTLADPSIVEELINSRQ